MREFDDLGTGYAPWVWEAANNTWSLLANWDGTPSAYGQHIYNYLLGRPVSCAPNASSPARVVAWDASWASPSHVAPGSSVTFMTLTTMNLAEPVREEFSLVNSNGATVDHASWEHLFMSTQTQATQITYRVPQTLTSGSYSVSITICDTSGTTTYGARDDALTFVVV